MLRASLRVLDHTAHGERPRAREEKEREVGGQVTEHPQQLMLKMLTLTRERESCEVASPDCEYIPPAHHHDLSVRSPQGARGLGFFISSHTHTLTQQAS